ncbi:hypothetical protein SERLADRAFT_467547, partial [Serpula lacrymans var. lacrymans S7.9]
IHLNISNLTQILTEKPTIHYELNTFLKIGRDYPCAGLRFITLSRSLQNS